MTEDRERIEVKSTNPLNDTVTDTWDNTGYENVGMEQRTDGTADGDNESDRREWDRDEEVSAEIAPPRPALTDREEEEERSGAGLGITALVLSILSLLFWPVVLGAAGIITGFFAYRRGAVGLGMWSMGIGAVSIIIALFISPFYR